MFKSKSEFVKQFVEKTMHKAQLAEKALQLYEEGRLSELPEEDMKILERLLEPLEDSGLKSDDIRKSVMLFYEITRKAGATDFVLVGGASGVIQGVKYRTKDVDIEINDGNNFKRLRDYLQSESNRFDGFLMRSSRRRIDFIINGVTYEVFYNTFNAKRQYLNTEIAINDAIIKVRKRTYLKTKYEIS